MNEKNKAALSDEAVPPLEWAVARMLRGGVIVAGLLMFAGWMTFMNFKANPLLKFHDYQSVPLLTGLQTARAENNWGLLMAYAGLALLVSLPMIRVLMTAVLFTKQRQKTLAGIAYFVFFILIVSLTLGIDL
jgi:uncharacterized membrane protein